MRPHLVEDQRDAQGVADVAGDLEQPAVLAGEPDRHDRRLRPLDELGDERLPAPVDRGLRPNLSGAVETAPAGKTTTTPPFSSCVRAAAREARLVFSASSVSLKSTGRMKPLTSGARISTALVRTRKSRAHLADQPRDDDPVEHAVGMVGDHDDRPGLGDPRERVRVVADVERELAHRGLKEILVRARDGAGCRDTSSSAAAARSPSRRAGSRRASAEGRSRSRS